MGRRTPLRLASILLVLVACSSCKLPKRGKGAPDASAPAQMPNAGAAGSPRGHEGAPLVPGVATASSAALPSTTATAAPPPPPPDPNAMPAADRAALEKAKQQILEVQALLNHGKDQPKPAESDLKSRCEEIETVRAAVEKRAEPDVKPFLETSKQLCSFDVPLFSANNALDQMRFSASQASKLLVCKVAERDIAKARALKPNHLKVRSAETRFRSICH